MSTCIRARLAEVERHIARGVAHLARQAALIAQLDRDGHDTELARAIFDTLRETLVLHQQDRERMLAASRRVTSARENCGIVAQPTIYRPADIRNEDAQRAARLTEMQTRAVDLLRYPAPDTFLGCQHQVVIPLPQAQA